MHPYQKAEIPKLHQGCKHDTFPAIHVPMQRSIVTAPPTIAKYRRIRD